MALSYTSLLSNLAHRQSRAAAITKMKLKQDPITVLPKWVRLRNLSPFLSNVQLHDLCSQVGVVQDILRDITSGFALVKFSTTFEACRARDSLNNKMVSDMRLVADWPDMDAAYELEGLLANRKPRIIKDQAKTTDNLIVLQNLPRFLFDWINKEVQLSNVS